MVNPDFQAKPNKISPHFYSSKDFAGDSGGFTQVFVHQSTAPNACFKFLIDKCRMRLKSKKNNLKAAAIVHKCLSVSGKVYRMCVQWVWVVSSISSVPRAQACCHGYLCLRPAWIRKKPRFLERSWLRKHTRQRERGWGDERGGRRGRGRFWYMTWVRGQREDKVVERRKPGRGDEVRGGNVRSQ